MINMTARAACYASRSQFALTVRGAKFLVHLLVVVMSCFSWAHAFGQSSQSPDPRTPVATGQIQEKTIRVGDRERSYVAYLPASLAPGAALVIVLHGSDMTGSRMRRATGGIFELLADRHGFALIYPNGYLENWNDCRKYATFPAKHANIDDVGFIRALIRSFAAEAKIDPKKVNVFGFSNGGHMAFRLAIEAPNEIAAVVAAAAGLPAKEHSSCASEGITSRVMLVNGIDDPLNPYDGGVGPFSTRVLSAQASAMAFAKRNDVVEPPSETTVLMPSKEDSTSVNRLTWSRGGRPVVALYTVRGGGHVIPQPVFRFPPFLGATSQFDSPSASWAFFASQ